MRVYNKNQNKR